MEPQVKMEKEPKPSRSQDIKDHVESTGEEEFRDFMEAELDLCIPISEPSSVTAVPSVSTGVVTPHREAWSMHVKPRRYGGDID